MEQGRQEARRELARLGLRRRGQFEAGRRGALDRRLRAQFWGLEARADDLGSASAFWIGLRRRQGAIRPGRSAMLGPAWMGASGTDPAARSYNRGPSRASICASRFPPEVMRRLESDGRSSDGATTTRRRGGAGDRFHVPMGA